MFLSRPLFQIVFTDLSDSKKRHDIQIAAATMEDAIAMVRAEFNKPHIVAVRDTYTSVYVRI